MRHTAVGLKEPDDLQAPGDARLVVGSEDRRAVRPNDSVVADDGHDAAIRPHRVHVRRYQERALSTAGQDSHDVAQVVTGDVAAEIDEAAMKLGTDLGLLAARAVDGHQLEEGAHQSVAIDLFDDSHRARLVRRRTRSLTRDG